MVISHRHDDDGSAGLLHGWRLTPLGMVLLVLILISVSSAVYIAVRPDPSPVATPTAPPAASPADGQSARIFSTSDAVDFTQTTYDGYVILAGDDAVKSGEAAPPYKLSDVLRRLELLRPQLSQNLYRRIQTTYNRTADTATIDRDEVLCGRPDVSRAEARLKLGGQDLAVVSVEKWRGEEKAGQLEVTVDLRSRVISEISCP